MDKMAIRNFAIWARNKLISDVAYRAGLMGITADGIADKLPQSTNSVHFYDIGTAEPYQITGSEILQRSNLVFQIKRKARSSGYASAYTSIIEEVAYTWFNRLIAIRFMEVNDYLPSHIRVLSSESGKVEPDIVTNPFDVDLGMNEKESSMILEFKQNNEFDELFKLLFIKQCNKLSEILPRLFEKTDDYTELLFNCSYVDQDGIVYKLTHDIPEEDFDVNRGGQVEIIGWLYQYYNSELKDDTFALLKKNVKITKERIPSATQLFTPDWIVRYMVENSLGRLWSEGHVNTSSQLRSKWKYYLDEAEQEPAVQVQLNDIQKEYEKVRLENIKIYDPCMGSGHILVYAFDVLMQIYASEGYNQRDAAVLILENNIFGLDIDDRAAQLAYFAVMMKARQYNRRVLDGTHDCHVLAIQESNGMSTLQTYMAPFGELSDVALRLINTYNDAKEYGSILNVSLSLEEIDALAGRLEEIRNNRSDDVEELMVEAVILNEFPPLLAQARIMVQKYDVVVTNPPYMGSGNMSLKLSKYLSDNYPETKSDLFSVFMMKGYDSVKTHCISCMVTMQSWMFLSSFEKMREVILEKVDIVSLLHMENMVMGIAFGTAVSVFRKKHIKGFKGIYNHIKYADIIDGIPATFPVSLNRNSIISADIFQSIPGIPIAYWISPSFVNIFSNSKCIGDYAAAKKGLVTGDDERFLRLWFEIDQHLFSQFENNHSKWQPINKGGAYRKWYGNNSYCVNWGSDGEELSNHKWPNGKQRSSLRNSSYFFKEGITWTYITSGDNCFRYYPNGFAFAGTGPGLFVNNHKDLLYMLGYCNSVVFAELLKMTGSETISLESGEVERAPVLIDSNTSIDTIVNENINICKKDWDSFETSWDFDKHPLI